MREYFSYSPCARERPRNCHNDLHPEKLSLHSQGGEGSEGGGGVQRGAVRLNLAGNQRDCALLAWLCFKSSNHKPLFWVCFINTNLPPPLLHNHILYAGTFWKEGKVHTADRCRGHGTGCNIKQISPHEREICWKINEVGCGLSSLFFKREGGVSASLTAIHFILFSTMHFHTPVQMDSNRIGNSHAKSPYCV